MYLPVLTKNRAITLLCLFYKDPNFLCNSVTKFEGFFLLASTNIVSFFWNFRSNVKPYLLLHTKDTPLTDLCLFSRSTPLSFVTELHIYLEKMPVSMGEVWMMDLEVQFKKIVCQNICWINFILANSCNCFLVQCTSFI